METLLLINSMVLWLVCLLNFVLLLAVVRKIERINLSGKVETLQTGSVAPPFRALSLQDGSLVGQDTYKGRNIAFVFIGIHCQPCREFMPDLLAMTALAQQHEVELILVSEADAGATNTYIREFGSDLPVLIAQRSVSKFMEDYKVKGTPWYYLINADGTIAASGFPGNHAEEIRAQIMARDGAPESK